MNAKKLAVILAILVVTALVLVWQFRPKDNSDDVPDVASEPTQITQEEPDTQSSILLNDKDSMDQVLAVRTLNPPSADFFGMTSTEYHRTSLRSTSIAITKEDLSTYGDFSFVTMDWERDFGGRAWAEYALTVFNLMLREKILTKAKPIIEVQNLQFPLCETPECQLEGPTKWRLLFPVLPDVQQVNPPLVLEQLPKRNATFLGELPATEEDIKALEPKLKPFMREDGTAHVLLRLQSSEIETWRTDDELKLQALVLHD
ncbi:MAG TPA: hypothetical protein PLC97_11830 [Myxococcota bacterium]|jgi:hypothetical protein|nr:hypothetical protein [Myxococcota bacterium]MBP8970200.1 hypothetical protein [Myxococcota bacterium]OQC35260.1 MAG: hypothetical protein BWX66_01646 [Deltaproteobacteria bacterium ADurb.Bin058]HQC45892.1 hypothetical protein [Myxococcota bacterium]HQL56239.1 hypothetical protein [Myxococcota bacterium]